MGCTACDLAGAAWGSFDAGQSQAHLNRQTGAAVADRHDLPKFEGDQKAPEHPADPLFKLEATTIKALSAPAAELGNQVISHFAAEEGVWIVKVNHAKMSIKAEASQPRPYGFKVRIYRTEDHLHAVEFHRRSGDAAAFVGLYRRIAELFEAQPIANSVSRGRTYPPEPQSPEPPKCCGSAERVELDFFDPPELCVVAEPPEPDWPELPTSRPGAAASLQPLLDMAVASGDRALHAEAACGLADAAADPLRTGDLCTPEACAAYVSILHGGCYAALSTLARLLSVLVTKPQAAACFADPGLWQALVGATVVQGACEELKRQFVQVATCALTLGAVAVSSEGDVLVGQRHLGSGRSACPGSACGGAPVARRVDHLGAAR
eukprot:NODE_1137_length_1233_cov_230.704584.p1 GENE.NODE_1137_length_1233_cov_230.704584~~NODE_1137_length_1233_cov_230.704584.p1  ORF type:complete len:378 (-),score=85.58 NODE_1137_length_1233_cov_230.704584:82-1215(-)